MASNLVPVIAGNLVGGSVLVGLAYHVIYRRGARAAAQTPAAAPPKPPAP
jgi:formate/nitrite transporter FocA (FNT family)